MRPISKIFLSSASVAVLAFAAPAYSQTPNPVNPERDPCQAPADQREPGANCPPADSPAGTAIQQGATTTSEAEQAITVVGSRIRRDRFNTADPVTIITRDSALDSGFNSTAETLQSTAVTGGTAQINDTFGGFVVDGGPGVNTLSLRGLGATRTLILLNGRRLAPAGTRGSVGAADLNTLPNAVLDRIEVLNTGASSVYGSDAVAGVVNIVTRTKFTGVSVEGAVTVPGIGAGASHRLSLVAGASGERFNLVGSFEEYQRRRITQGDRSFTACPTQRRLNGVGSRQGSGDYIDPRTGLSKCFPLEEGGVTVNTIGTGFVFSDRTDVAPGFQPTPAGSNLYCNRFRPNAAQTGGSFPGFECVGGNFYNPVTGAFPGTELNLRDTSSPAFLQQDVVSPARTYTGFLSGTYDTDFFGDGQLYGELLVTRRKSQQNGQRQFTLDYPRNSVLIPAALRGNPLSGAIGVRVFADYGIYDSHQTQDYVKASGGFRGSLPFAPSWRYDFFGSKSWSDGTYSFEQILADRLAQSLAVNAAGTACTVTTGGCVAAPALTPAIVAGRFREVAPAWFDYVTEDVVGHTKFRETTFNATFDGPLFQLPGGMAQAVVGAEYRRSRIADIPGDDSIRGNLHGFSSAPTTIGKDSVWEAFAEVELPILRDLPFAYALTVNASGRHTDYQSYGSGNTYKIGALYSPTQWLSFRGSYGTSFRAPALFEQFLGSTTGFLPNTTDPCHELANEDNSTIITNCRAQGVPASFLQNNSVTVIQRGGAEAGLKAEKSKNLTVGGVIQPDFGDFGRLSLAVDYFRVEVNNGVAQLGAGTIARGCYNGTRPEYCQFITRAPYTGPGSGALSVTQTFINIATDIAKGIDFVMDYSVDVGPGKLDMGAQLVYMMDRVNQTDPDSAGFDYRGAIGNPKYAGTGHVGYDWGPWYARWTVDYIKGTNDRFITEDLGYDPATYDFRLPDYWLHTASLRYETKQFSLSMGVRNVFNKKPPQITAEDPFVNTIGNVPLQAGFDMRGRTFFVNTRVNF